MFGIFKRKNKKYTVTVIEAGTRTTIFETEMKKEAFEFLERNMHANEEISVIKDGLNVMGKIIITILSTGKLVEVSEKK